VRNNNENENGIDQKVDAVEEEYGSFADVYAETRSKAAADSGDAEASEEWKQVAEELKREDDSE
jgi:hypothetical protein